MIAVTFDPAQTSDTMCSWAEFFNDIKWWLLALIALLLLYRRIRHVRIKTGPDGTTEAEVGVWSDFAPRGVLVEEEREVGDGEQHLRGRRTRRLPRRRQASTDADVPPVSDSPREADLGELDEERD